MKPLLINSIQCPDGTILTSKHRHDYVDHTQEDGRYYALDGGEAYRRLIAPDDDWTDLAIYTDDPHEVIRERFTWTRNYDKDGYLLPEPETILLKDLEDGHVEALIGFTAKSIAYPDYITRLFQAEKEYREQGCQKYGCVAYDIDPVTGEEINLLFIEEDKPEKLYKTHVDHYGDIRELWRPL